jgi:hypothetical protein
MAAEPGRIRALLWPHGFAVVFYLVVAIGLTWPMATHFTSAIAGANPVPGYLYASPEDGIQNVWNIWWTLQALSAGQNPFWSDKLFYPDGVQLYVQTVGLINFLPVLPVATLFGPVAGFNSALLLAMAGSGYAAFLLVRFFTPRVGLALLAGLLFTASPLHMFKLQIHQLNLVSLQWLTLYLLALLHLARAPSWRTVAATVATVLLVLLGDWYWLLIALMVSIPWAVFALIESSQRLRLLRAFAAVGAGVVLVSLPLLIGLYQARHRLPPEGPRGPIWEAYIAGFSSDALGMLAPNILHPLWGERLWALSRPAHTNFAIDGWYVAVGWVLLACGLLGLPELWRRQRPLAVLGLAAWLLALGPTLQIAYQQTGIPLPYALIQDLPLVQLARRPSLFVVVVQLVLLVAAVLGLERLLARQTPRRAALLLAGLSALALIELAPPGLPQRRQIALDPPPLMRELAARPGAVADLPFRQTEDGRSLLNQMGHGQPIIGGYVARWPTYPALERSPLLNALARLTYEPEDIIPLDQRALQAMQCAYPIRHIILFEPDLRAGDDSLVATLTSALAGGAVYRQHQGDYIWYELPVPAPPCPPFVSLGAGWDGVEQQDAVRWRWMGEHAAVVLVNPAEHAQQVELSMHLEAYDSARPLEVLLNDTPLGVWQVHAGEPRNYRLYVSLAPGVNQLSMRAPATPEPGSARMLSLRAYGLRLIALL